MRVMDGIEFGFVKYQMSISGANGQKYEYKQMDISNVLVNGSFKVVLFHKDVVYGLNIIAVADGYDNYYRNCIKDYQRDKVMKFRFLVNPKFYTVTAEEGNDIYRQIKSTKQISKNGTEFYRWNFKEDEI